ncbi:MAG: hypothetical protein K2P06_10325 [Muribaculaceae bacterium]|nr:hypothetical protein [Muribaculaceae bacterium]
MDTADSLIEQYPDSALTILQSIDSTKITGAKLCARHALLTIQARVKTYRNSISDTAALPLLDYYSDHGPDFDRMRAAFYKAEIYSTLNNFQKKIFNLSQAEDIASRLHNDYWLAKIYELEADIFHANGNYSHSIKRREAAIEKYKLTGKERNVNFGYADLAYTFHAAKNNDVAFNIIDSITDISKQTDDTVLTLYCTYFKSYMCINSGKFELADSLRRVYNELRGDSVSVGFDELYRDAFIELHRNADINDALLANLRKSIDNKVDSSRFYYLLTNLYFKRSDLESFSSAVDTLLIQDAAVTHTILRQSVVAEQLNYSRLQLSEARHKNELLIVFIISTLIIIVLTTILYLWRLRAIRLKKDALIYSISYELAKSETTIKQQNSQNDLLYQQLQKEILASKSVKNEEILSSGKNYERIFEIYSKQWGLISKICTTYLNSGDKNEKNSGYEKVMKMIAELSSTANLNELVKGINTIRHGVFDDLRNINNSINQNDIYMLALLYTGTSMRIISIIFDISLATLYRRRDRISTIIKASAHKSKENILNSLKLG